MSEILVKELFMFPNYKIIVLEAYHESTVYAFRYNSFCHGRGTDVKYGVNEISNRKINTSNYQMLGKLSALTDNKCEAMFKAARYLEKEYPDFENPIDGSKYTSALESLKSFLTVEQWSVPENKTWIIIPKIPKKLKGQKFEVLFDLCKEDFSRGSNKVSLPVYMTEINETTTEVSYSVEIPDYLYDFLMLHPDLTKRPPSKVYTTNFFSDLHTYLRDLSNEATGVIDFDKEMEKSRKVILVKFRAKQDDVKDGYYGAHAGKDTTVFFQFFVGWQKPKGTLFNDMFNDKDLGIYVNKQYVKGKLEDIPERGRKAAIGNLSGFRIIEWTQEREDFLMQIELNFKKLSDNLNDYLSDLDAGKLDELVLNNIKLLN